MGPLDNELTALEKERADRKCSRLHPYDFSNVQKAINAVDRVAALYFSSGNQYQNAWAFMQNGIIGTPFFSVYLVGGYVNKPGERRDIDLLVATNMRWTDGFLSDEWSQRPESWDPVWRELNAEFAQGYKVERTGELPSDYNIGITEGKALIRIIPDAGKKIDLIYARSWEEDGLKFIDEKAFNARDTDLYGHSLPKVPLYRATSPLNQATQDSPTVAYG
ncbi:MAG: hypothetical protein EPN86_06115 [Nanoarchaeota archaeon]|nr:MAG: hypothetical protein EPN86_06115 [Nanoarchaeota archaeon]